MLTYIDDLAFDIKYHTDTLRWQDLRSLDVVGGNKDHGVFYQPTQARTLRYVFNKLKLPKEGAFLDLRTSSAWNFLIYCVKSQKPTWHVIPKRIRDQLNVLCCTQMQRNMPFRSLLTRYFYSILLTK
jgi:hypothetical protein